MYMLGRSARDFLYEEFKVVNSLLNEAMYNSIQ